MRGYLILKNKLKDKFFDACFNAYWKNNIDISNEKKIYEILEFCEIDKKEFFLKIQDQKTKDQLKYLTNLAFEKDIFGAPTFVVNDKIFWGQDRLDFALDECNF
jgi:2-hydroxychromene-2-carboxylate isomerase